MLFPDVGITFAGFQVSNSNRLLCVLVKPCQRVPILFFSILFPSSLFASVPPPPLPPEARPLQPLPNPSTRNFPKLLGIICRTLNCERISISRTANLFYFITKNPLDASLNGKNFYRLITPRIIIIIQIFNLNLRRRHLHRIKNGGFSVDGTPRQRSRERFALS